VTQIRALLGLGVLDSQLEPVVRGLQILWLVAAGQALFGRRLSWPAQLLVLLVPALYLGVHLVYQVTVYYPRHVIAGYLSMGIVTMYAAVSPPETDG
jgi:hypothetical protein